MYEVNNGSVFPHIEIIQGNILYGTTLVETFIIVILFIITFYILVSHFGEDRS